MKLQPLYRHPFTASDNFDAISRREAAQLIWQWRRNGDSIRRLDPNPVRARGYLFRGTEGGTAVMALCDAN